MEITIKIDNDEFQKEVQELLVQRTVNRCEQEMYPDGRERIAYRYHDLVKAAIRQVLREHIDDISKRATEAAATTIANKAIKQQADKITEAIING